MLISPFIIRSAIVIVGLITLLAFAPAAVRWYRQRLQRPAREYPHGFAVQHLSHLALVVFHLIVIMLLLGVEPFVFLPYHDGYQWLSPKGIAGAGFAGMLLFIAGNIMRVAATYAMGSAFDKAVLIREGHRLVTSGPFRFTRHPIYAGNVLAELGLGVALASWPLVAFTLLISFPINNYRASVEEDLLERHFGGEYQEYRKRVGRWWV